MRDVELLGALSAIEVGLTITTADESIRKIFEPYSPSIEERIQTLGKLHSAGLRTYAMIAPLLSKPEGLVTLLSGKVDCVFIDRMNYHYADWVYRKYGLEYAMTDNFFTPKKTELVGALKGRDTLSIAVLIHVPLTYKAPTTGSTIASIPTFLCFFFFDDSF